jgi:hypothetical protein
MTTVDDHQIIAQIVARARRRLPPPGEHTEWDHQLAARDALDVIAAGIAEQEDRALVVFAGLVMPAWDEPSGRWPVVESRPLLELLEASDA